MVMRLYAWLWVLISVFPVEPVDQLRISHGIPSPSGRNDNAL